MAKTIGKNLKEVRNYYKLSIDEFAKKLNISSRAYSSYEYDERKPTYELYFNIRTVFDVNLNWLIANDGDMLMLPSYEQVEDKLTQKVENILRKNGLIK